MSVIIPETWKAQRNRILSKPMRPTVGPKNVAKPVDVIYASQEELDQYLDSMDEMMSTMLNRQLNRSKPVIYCGIPVVREGDMESEAKAVF